MSLVKKQVYNSASLAAATDSSSSDDMEDKDDIDSKALKQFYKSKGGNSLKTEKHQQLI